MNFANLTQKTLLTCLFPLFLTGCGGAGDVDIIELQEPIAFASTADLGGALFNDVNLSNTRTQSCATCHASVRAFTDPRHNSQSTNPNSVGYIARTTGVSVGDDGFSVGVRNAPTAMYAALTPKFSKDANGYFGGQFWDGRASTLEDQAGGPPLNPVEMQMPDKAAVVERLLENDNYVNAFKGFYGQGIFDDIDQAYAAMTQAIAAFERTDTFAPFNAKWDAVQANTSTFSNTEALGATLFADHCMSCHSSAAFNPNKQTFSDYRYYNLAVPDNQALTGDEDDQGLFENPEVVETSEIGKFKTPTLRNVAVTAPYLHNGVYKDLKITIAFFNNALNLQLSDGDVDALECFMRTLTDDNFVAAMPATTQNCSE
ncbi:methylamine utilization protein MauG [Thiosulfatimonas sediminis]|uniref:Methylamine utilization protein MauG n=1 Tax=Thiosulfatimonas sediminis TaxID=2675054 RepID=A0A6F8PTK2_9GAMM|nr:cytochrome c peroxidase [Thiosulfatimonas sediminis]BBP45354.1 methylamine utilization protein MauG [Thiosulfatimonas sediminis]